MTGSHLSRRKRALFLAFTLLVPAVVICLTEAALRLFHYGSAYDQWVESADGQGLKAGGRYLMLNPELARKYFHSLSTVPFSNEDAFEKVKKANSFRVFVLGESSAAGYPYEPNGSFSRFLQKRLSLLYQGSRIEVVNCAMSAICSYTIRDLMPGVLAQKPDVILIYAGHNEYYGALGAGSTESFGSSRFLVNLVIGLEKFRLVQLLRNATRAVAGLFTEEKHAPPGTLMGRMAREQEVGYDSDLYYRGLSQFEGNMNDILAMAVKAGIPVIVGTLTCNLKDQQPFVSIPSAGYPPADQVYGEAQQALAKGTATSADSLFRFARDLDGLKFRAPGVFNTAIRRLAARYGVPVIDIDSAFAQASPDHIVGDNLMVDHLHPNLDGYRAMGKLFFEKMKECGDLPRTRPVDLSDEVQDSMVLADNALTALDSVIAEYKMAVLKNNWPFVQDGRAFSYSAVIRPNNRIDSLAADWLEHKISWKNAHLAATDWYLAHNDARHAFGEVDALVDQYPVNDEYNKFAVTTALSMDETDRAYRYLSRSYAIGPSAFNTRWLGVLSLARGETERARQYLDESLVLDSSDPKIWYDLAVAYVQRDRVKSLMLLDRALAGDARLREAIDLRNRLLHSAG